MSGTDRPTFLTTREVADLLRVKERKVYDLAAADEIPHRRVTGKLLFPQDEIMRWLEGEGQGPRPAVLAGSHDPLLDWAVRESGCGLATLFDGSGDGMARFKRAEAALTGMHIPERDGWNLGAVAAAELSDAVLIGFATRVQGLIVAPALTGVIRGLADLKGRRVAMRQAGAGARLLFDRLTCDLGLAPDDMATTPVRTETEAAQAVALDEADAVLGLEAVARQFRLAFVPLVSERFDLLIDRRAYFTPPVQRLLAFARGHETAAKAASLGGYDLSVLGEIRWISP